MIRIKQLAEGQKTFFTTYVFHETICLPKRENFAFEVYHLTEPIGKKTSPCLITPWSHFSLIGSIKAFHQRKGSTSQKGNSFVSTTRHS
jgi:hypothetical protein